MATIQLCFVTVPYLQYIFCQHGGDEQVKDPPVGFEPTISAGEWLQTYTLDSMDTGTGRFIFLVLIRLQIAGQNGI